jgi:hypothetical protein
MMKSDNWNRVDRIPARGGVDDAQDIAAALLLRRVETMLRNGQPRQAIAHIVEMTGVGSAEAAAFVDDLRTSIFS